MKMEWDDVVNPTSDNVLPTEALAAAIPEIEWTKGKAGVMVSQEVADKLEVLWEEHLQRVTEKVLID